MPSYIHYKLSEVKQQFSASVHIIFNQGGFPFIHFQPPHFASPSMASLTHGNRHTGTAGKCGETNDIQWIQHEAGHNICSANGTTRMVGLKVLAKQMNVCSGNDLSWTNCVLIDAHKRVCCNCRLFLQGVLQLLPAASTLKLFCGRKIDFQASTTQPLDLTNMFVCSAAKCYAVQVNLSTARTKSEASMLCCFYSSCQL